MSREMKYESLVSASTRDEAIEIALEALPRGRHVVRTEAEDVSAEEGPNSFRVTVVYGGGSAGEAPE